jgi:hypothetical protein
MLTDLQTSYQCLKVRGRIVEEQSEGRQAMGDRQFEMIEMMRQGVVVQTRVPGKLSSYSPAPVNELLLHVPASRECQHDVHWKLRGG